jgi:hypothetical protein
MEPTLVDGKNLGAFVITEVPGGKDEYGAVEGIACWDGNSLSIVDPFGKNAPFPIPEHAYNRIRLVDEKMRLVFEKAEYYVPLLMKPLAENADLTGLAKIGWSWPTANDD